MAKIKRFAVTAGLVGLMSVSLAACGGSNTGNNPSAPTTAATAVTGGDTGTAEYKVSLTEMAINPKTLEVKAGKTKFIVSNDGQFPHDLTIEGVDGGKTPVMKKGEGPSTLEVDLKPGTYKWICSVGDHAEKGMNGELVVK